MINIADCLGRLVGRVVLGRDGRGGRVSPALWVEAVGATHEQIGGAGDCQNSDVILTLILIGGKEIKETILIRSTTTKIRHSKLISNRAGVMVKWSACLPCSLTIRVRIPLKSTVFSVKFMFEENENKKRPGLAHF